MRKHIVIFVILILNTGIFAQTNMQIRKTDGSLVSIPITEIDSIYYSNESPTTVTDYDGNVYSVVQIGNQTWMGENLRTTHYTDGTAIPKVETNAAWAALGDNNTDRGYCWYGNDSVSYSQTYGALYTWATVMDGENSSSGNPSGVQGICPDGWHVPSDDEWIELEMFLGMTQAQANQTGWRGSDQGNQLKEEGTDHWYSPNNGSNSSGFTALGSGGRYPDDGIFGGINQLCFYWSATEKTTVKIWLRFLLNNSGQIWRDGELKSEGFSARCVKN